MTNYRQKLKTADEVADKPNENGEAPELPTVLPVHYDGDTAVIDVSKIMGIYTNFALSGVQQKPPEKVGQLSCPQS